MATLVVRFTVTEPLGLQGEQKRRVQAYDVVSYIIDPPWWTGDPLTSGLAPNNPHPITRTLIVTSVPQQIVDAIIAFVNSVTTDDRVSMVSIRPSQLKPAEEASLNANGWLVLPYNLTTLRKIVRRKTVTNVDDPATDGETDPSF